MPTRLHQTREWQFQQDVRGHPWFSDFLRRYGEEPNLNDPQYDYRGAWHAGLMPTMNRADQSYHWPSSHPETGASFKSADHPTAWMEPFMQRTGRDPTSYGPAGRDQAIIDALNDPAIGRKLLGFGSDE